MPVTRFIVAGGLMKNALLMQIYADVLRRPLSSIGSDQGPALGSAIHAAVAAGAYPDVPRRRGRDGPRAPSASTCRPGPRRAYDELYAEYRTLHDYFGRGGEDERSRTGCARSRNAAPRGQTPAQPYDGQPRMTATTVARMRARGRALHAELVRYELVVWTAGNVSARVPGRT